MSEREVRLNEHVVQCERVEANVEVVVAVAALKDHPDMLFPISTQVSLGWCELGLRARAQKTWKGAPTRFINSTPKE